MWKERSKAQFGDNLVLFHSAQLKLLAHDRTMGIFQRILAASLLLATAQADEIQGIKHYGFTSRIVGGSPADASNYPFHVNLGGCGGSL